MSLSSILHTSEAALQQVLLAWSQSAGSTLGNCSIYLGQSADPANPFALPSVVISASQPVELLWGSGWFELMVKVTVETQVDDETSGLVHPARVQDIRTLLENLPNLQALINAPAAPAVDTRAVQNYLLSALKFEGEQQSMLDRRLSTELTYYVCASSS